MADSIYLDNHSVRQPSEAVIQAMIPFFREFWGTPSAPHFRGQELLPHVEKAYQKIYSLLGAADSDAFIFTANGAEAANHVIRSVFEQVGRKEGKNHFIVSTIDEAPSILATEALRDWGAQVSHVDANSKGFIEPELLFEIITPRTALISLSAANGLTGVLNPIEEIGELCRERGVLLHLEISHIIGKNYFDFAEMPVDFVTFCGNLIGGPKGSGGLCYRQGKFLPPLTRGGTEQDGARGGMLNVPALIGLGHAAEETQESMALMVTEAARLRTKLEEGVQERIPGSKVLFEDSERVSNCTAIAFPGVSSEALLFLLNQRGLCASFGGGNFQRLELVAKACGVPEEQARMALSFALSIQTSEADIELALDLIEECVGELQRISADFFEPQEVKE